MLEPKNITDEENNVDDEEPTNNKSSTTKDSSDINLDPDNLVSDEKEKSQDRQMADIISADRRSAKGTLLPSSQEYREYEDLFGGKIVGGGLGAEQVDPRFQDLPKLRAQTQGFADSASRSAAKLIPQTIAQAGELAGYVGDVQAYDDVFRGLVNYAAEGMGADPVLDENYEDVGNWLSEASKATNTAFDEMLPVYREDPNAVWAPGDSAWWTENIGNLIETVGAFGGVSGAVRGGLSAALKGSVRGLLSRGASVSNLRGGAQAINAAETGANLGTAISTGYAEGMMVGMQGYKKTYQRKKAQLQENTDLKPQEIERQAKEAASQHAATTAGINSVLLPFLNYTGAALLGRGGRGATSRMQNEALELGAEEGFENIDNVAKRIADTPAGTNMLAKEGQQLFRESALESTEELAAQVSETEGAYAATGKGEDNVGSRIWNSISTPQAALEATLGAFAGAGQGAIMKSLPTIEDPEGEGKISRRQLEWRRQMEWASHDKSELEDRINDMTEAKAQLQKARQLEKDGNNKEAEKVRAQAMDDLRTTITADNISRGVQHQLKSIYQGIKNMDDNKAENLGFDIDPESDQYYKDKMEEEIDRIDQYTEEYERLNNQYNFGTQEEFAGIPKTLLNLQIRKDNKRREVENLEDRKEDLKERQPTEEDAKRQARLNREYEAELDNLNQQQEALREVRDILSNWDIENKGDITFGQLVDNFGAERLKERLNEVEKKLPSDVMGAIRDLQVDDALEFAEYTINKRKSRIDELNNLKTDAYENFLTQRNLDDNQLARQLFDQEQKQINNQYQETYKDLDHRKANAEIKIDALDRKFNHLTSSKGRQQLLDRTEEFLEEEREKMLNSGKQVIDQASTPEEVKRIIERYPDAVSESLSKYGQEKIEQLQTEKTISDEANAMEPESEAAREDSEQRSQQADEEVKQEVKEAQEEAEEQQQQEETQEEETSVFSEIQDAITGEDESEQETEEGEQTTTTTTTAEEKGKQKIDQVKRNTLEDHIDNYIKNRAFAREDYSVDQVKDNLSDWLDRLDSVDNQDLKDHLLEYGLDKFRSQRQAWRNRRKQREESVEETDKAPENVEDDKDTLDSRDATEPEPPKTVEYGSSIIYGFDNQQSRAQQIEDPQIESSQFPFEDDQLSYRPLSREEAQELGFSEDNNSTFREDVEELDTSLYKTLDRDLSEVENLSDDEVDTIDAIDRLAIGVYRNGNLIGYLPDASNISEEKTPKNPDGREGNNVRKQRAMNRKKRKTVIDNVINGNLNQIPLRVSSKTPGHLTINTDENGNKKFQKIRDAFPNQKKEFFVIRNGRPYLNQNDSVDPDNLINNKEYFDQNEGTAGMLVTMGNGKKLAIPIWLPMLSEVNENIEETIYQIATTDDTIEDSGAKIDLPASRENQIKKYVYTTSASIHALRKAEEGENRDVHLTVNDQGEVGLANQRTETVYHTNEEFVEKYDSFESFEDNKETVKELLKEMRINADLDGGLNERNPRSSTKVLKADNQGNLNVEEYDTYNDLLSEYAETDVDATYSVTVNGQEEYLAYEHPSIITEVDTDSMRGRPETPSVNVDTSPTDSGPTPSGEATTTENEEDLNEDSEVAGDTEDVKTPDATDNEEVEESEDIDPQATSIAEEIVRSDEYDSVDDYIEDHKGEVKASTAKDLRDQIESEIESMTDDLQVDNIREEGKRIFKSHSSLSQIGTLDQYLEYVSNIFPNSEVNQIVYHASEDEFEKFDLNKKTSSEEDGIFFFSERESAQKLRDALFEEENTNKGSLKSAIINLQDPKDLNLENKPASSIPGIISEDKIDGDGAILRNVVEMYAGEDDQLVVFDVDDIHILGSKRDTEMFREFVKDKSEDEDILNQLNRIANKYSSKSSNDQLRKLQSRLNDLSTKSTNPNTLARISEEIEKISSELDSRYEGTKLRKEFNNINTRVNENRSTDEIKQSLDKVKSLEERVPTPSAEQNEQTLYDRVKQARNELESELESRAELDEDVGTDFEDTELDEELFNDLGGLNQDLGHRTYTPNGIIERNIDGPKRIDKEVVREQLEEDIAQDKLNITCKT